jgi:hypothetical protein
LEFVRRREETSPEHSRAVEFRWGATQTVLNFRDKRTCHLSNSRLREKGSRNLKWAL